MLPNSWDRVSVAGDAALARAPPPCPSTTYVRLRRGGVFLATFGPFFLAFLVNFHFWTFVAVLHTDINFFFVILGSLS